MTPADLVAERLRSAGRVVALTGAGVSAASGIPTFRGADGLWKKVRPQTLATPEAFEQDPKLVWEWYDWRRGMVRQAVPNGAHEVLGRWTRQRAGFTLITQNVDGLHERAGAESLLRLHGSIWHVRCAQACERGRKDWLDTTVPQPRLPPTCPHCGGLVRPAVVWFGEPLDPDVLRQATAAAEGAEVFLVVGTSSVVYPAAGLAGHAKRHGAFTVELNTEATAISGEVDVSLLGPAADTLAALEAALGASRPLAEASRPGPA
jgi:NAD-dependent deacetylase